MINEKVTARGEVTIKVIDENGNVRETHTHNTIMNTGLSYFTGRLLAAPVTGASHMAIGTGSTSPTDKTRTTLVTEVSRQALTSTTQVTTTVTNDSIQYVASFAANQPAVASTAVIEAGLFNAASAGTMIARTVFGGVVTKTDKDTLQLTWKIIFV